MENMVEKKPRKSSPPGTRKKRKKPAGASVGLLPTELQTAAPPFEVNQLFQTIEANGGKVFSVYREPYGGKWLLIAALPIDRVEPTPYQRNLSDTHARKLEAVIGKIGRFLDPIIAVRAQKEGKALYWTPNGYHRLSAMKELGAKSITAIFVPESATAYQILALNTEKAHNLREKALEVIRMYKELAQLGRESEEAYALEFEEPSLITLGLAYEERPRFSGGPYHPILKRVEQFLNKPLWHAHEVLRQRARTLLDLDDIVIEKVQALKEKGLTSPYLKSFVVARCNPLRFRPKDADPLTYKETLARMKQGASQFKTEKIKVEDIARSGGAPEAD